MAQVHPWTVKQCYLPYVRVLRDPEDDGHGVGRGEETDGDRSVQEADRKAGSSRMRTRGATTKIIFC